MIIYLRFTSGEGRYIMDNALKEQLMRSMFRIRKVGMTFHQGFDINMGEIVVMNGIAKNASGLDKKICVSDIQTNLYITKPAVSQIFSSLEKKGYISREVDTNDRRKILVTLTPKGHEVVKHMKDYSNKMLSEIISRLGEDDTKQLIDLFNRFADISEDLKTETLQVDKKF